MACLLGEALSEGTETEKKVVVQARVETPARWALVQDRKGACDSMGWPGGAEETVGERVSLFFSSEPSRCAVIFFNISKFVLSYINLLFCTVYPQLLK